MASARVHGGIPSRRMRSESASQPPALPAERWQTVPGLVLAFLGRSGGAGEGSWCSLNLSEGVGDDPENVAENWRTVERAYAGLRIVRMRQVHGARVLHVRGAEPSPPECDGLTTDAAGLGLAVLTADCVPILMAAPERRVAVAVHAGWRGTLAGIAGTAVESACAAYDLRPEDLRVALGPSIGACCYEVDAEIGASLEARFGAMREAWSRSGSKGRLDLRGANRRILAGAGVPPEQVVDVGPCTACAFDRFFSHRRSGGETGRQLSLVGWRQIRED